ncbi:MAG TPA: COQ9 family protein [Thermohalobaculum sp.]|nr:COQ9 family protein [Thermohalobaculum sp.]
MENQPNAEAGEPTDPMSRARAEVVEAALPHVVFDGWSRKTLDAATADAGVDPGLAQLAFPRGGPDLAIEFHRMMDRRLAERLASDPAIGRLKMRERIAYAVRCRLELVAEHREAVRRAATLFALPVYVPDGARMIWETADTIWTALGDDSTDYNWYTKRAILSSVYPATVLYWIGDDTPGHSATWSFLDRRIDEVMRFEKTKSMLAENRIAKAALWGPGRLVEVLTGAARREPNVPTYSPGPRTPPPAPEVSQGPATATPGGPPPPEH